MRSRRSVRILGVLSLLTSLALAGCGGLAPLAAPDTPDPGPTATTAAPSDRTGSTVSTDINTPTPRRDRVVTGTVIGAPSVTYRAYEAGDFAVGGRVGPFGNGTRPDSIEGARGVALLTGRAQLERIAFDRLRDRPSLVAFVNRTDFRTHTLLVLTRRFGGRGGAFELVSVGVETGSRTTWRVVTARKAGPMQAESWGMLLLRLPRSGLPEPDRIRLTHTDPGGTTTNRTVEL